MLAWDCVVIAGLSAASPAGALALAGLLQHSGAVSCLTTAMQRIAAARTAPHSAASAPGGAVASSADDEDEASGLVNLGYWKPSAGVAGQGVGPVSGGSGLGRRGAAAGVSYLEASCGLSRLVAGAVLPFRTSADEAKDASDAESDGNGAHAAPGRRVLCVGCGGDAELRFIHKQFLVNYLEGADPSPVWSSSAELPTGVGLKQLAADHLLKCYSHHEPFSAILAVDSIYHMDKHAFLQQSARLLEPGGRLAFSDVVLRDDAPMWVSAVLRCMDIRLRNQWTAKEYRQQLAIAGLKVICFESLQPHVLDNWLPTAITRHLDYVLVHVQLAPRPRVAVIGSGMAGCVAAHLLESTHDVTIFEARDRPNLAGAGIRLANGTMVDIPLRMFGPHYYQQACAMMAHLGVPTSSVDFSAAFWGPKRTTGSGSSRAAENMQAPLQQGRIVGDGDGDGDVTLITTSPSFWQSILDRLKIASELIRLSYVFRFCRAREKESFGAFASRKRMFSSPEIRTFFR